jgi:hypothetical protein
MCDGNRIKALKGSIFVEPDFYVKLQNITVALNSNSNDISKNLNLGKSTRGFQLLHEKFSI